MNSTIKFMAWDTEKKKWLDETDFAVCNCGNIMLRKSGTNEYACTKNERYVVVRSTGLLDKDGEEIYEGDVVSWYDDGAPDASSIKRAVVYSAPGFYLYKRMSDKVDVGTFSTPEVREKIIGTIYENPDLVPV